MKFKAKGREFAKILRFFLTLGQNNFGNEIPFTTFTTFQILLSRKKKLENIICTYKKCNPRPSGFLTKSLLCKEKRKQVKTL